MNNPLLDFKKDNLLNFSLITAEHFAPAVNQLLSEYALVIEQVCNLEHVTWDNLINPLDLVHAKLNIVWSAISHLSNVKNTDAVRCEHEKLLPVITQFYSDLMHNHKLFMQIKKLVDSLEFAQLNPTQQYILKMQMRDFKLSGVDLDQQAKAKFSGLLNELSQLTNKFSSNVMDATEKWSLYLEPEEKQRLQGVPEHVLARASEKAQKHHKSGFLLGLDAPTYIAIVSYCNDRLLRQEFYNAYVTKATINSGPELDNTPLIDKILNLRQELAQLVGFKNYAQYSLATKMADNFEQVIKFLQEIAAKAKKPALMQLKVLEEFAHKLGLVGSLQAYDIPYYAQQYQQITYNINQEALRPYFPEHKVMHGIFLVAEKLYGIKLQEVTAQLKHTCWHDSVQVYTVTENANILGYLYTDLYAREQKREGAWMAELFDRCRLENKLQLPVVFLNCNFAPPTLDCPGLLTHDDVETAFHEFGHCLHGLLTKVDYLGASGMHGVPWDGVELPSQFFENWAWQFDVIQEISGHYQTGEPLPREIFNNLAKTKIYNSGLMILRQIEYALFDLLIHANLPENQNKTVQQILDEVRQDIAVIQPPKLNKFQNSFMHIFDGGYAAGYYSYLWADVLSCDAFSYFAASNIYNAKLGKSFKENILEKGGSEDFMLLYKNYAHSEPNVTHLLKHYGLITDHS